MNFTAPWCSPTSELNSADKHTRVAPPLQCCRFLFYFADGRSYRWYIIDVRQEGQSMSASLSAGRWLVFRPPHLSALCKVHVTADWAPWVFQDKGLSIRRESVLISFFSKHSPWEEHVNSSVRSSLTNEHLQTFPGMVTVGSRQAGLWESVSSGLLPGGINKRFTTKSINTLFITLLSK